MNSLISVPLTILVLVLESCSLFIHSCRGSFTPQILIECSTVNHGLELAHTYCKVPSCTSPPNPVIGDVVLVAWNWPWWEYLCHIDQHLLPIRVFVLLQRAGLAAHRCLQSIHPFLFLIYSTYAYWALKCLALQNIFTISRLPHIWVWSNSPHPSNSNFSWKLMKISPFRAFFFCFHVT